MRNELKRSGARGGVVLLATLLLSTVVIAMAPAAEVASAEGSAFGVREAISMTATPLVTAAVPPNASQHDEDAQAVVLDTFGVAQVSADACLEEGIQADLQAQMNTARVIATGGDPAAQPEPSRQTATVPSGYGVDDFCLTPAATQVPANDDTNPNCEAYDPAAEAPATTCQALLQLWNGRGAATTVDVAGAFQELRSEAVGRCVGAAPEFMTGTAYTLAGDVFISDPSSPNENLDPLALGLAESSTAIFWETNWDPVTNTTTDGSDTVWVNALHIVTPTEDYEIGHSEATLDCAQGEVPVGGYPRDITITPSKGSVTYDKVFNLSGSVTPATEFDTPKACVEGVNVTIRRDVVGGAEEFEDIAVVQTDTSGNFSYDVHADKNSQWIAFIDKDEPANCAQVASSAEPVLVKPFVGLKTNHDVVSKGDSVKFSVRLLPCAGKVGTIVKLRRIYSGSKVKIDTAKLDDDCKAVFIRDAIWKGTAVFDAAWTKQDDLHQNGNSRPKAVRVRKNS